MIEELENPARDPEPTPDEDGAIDADLIPTTED